MSQNNTPPELLDALTRSGVLIHTSVRYWRATKKLRAEDLGLDPAQLSDRLISLGHKKLLPKDRLQRFALLEGRAHALVESSSFPFLNGIARFLPNAKLADVNEQLTRLQAEFFAERDAFLAQYPMLRTAALGEWAETASRLAVDPDVLVANVAAAFPDPGRLERKYRFETQYFQVTVPEGLEVDLVQAADQAAISAARQQAANQARQQIHEGVDRFVSDAVATLREQTAGLCDEMLTSIRESKTGVHQRTLNRLSRFIDNFRELNFAGDAQMDTLLENARQELLSTTAEQYRDDTFARERLEGGLSALRDTARDLSTRDTRQLVERFGQVGRRRLHRVA